MRGERAQAARYLALLSGGMSKQELRSRFGALAFVFYDEKSLATVQDFLREFTAEWIESGIAEDGSEWPSGRNFTPRLANVASAENAISAEGSLLELLPEPHAVRAMAKCVEGSVQVAAARAGGGVYHIIPRAEARGIGCPPTMLILPDGGFSYLQPFHLPASSGGREEVSKDEYLEILAANFFMEFYQSEWRFRLMRCRKCGIFALPDRKLRMQYQYGWHCAACSSAGTATARLRKQAKERRQRYLTLAVEAWQKWRPKYGERAVWVAGELNQRLGPREEGIKRNFITRNAPLIARMAGEMTPRVIMEHSLDRAG